MAEDQSVRRKPRGPSLGNIHGLREIQNENIEQHEREPKRAKVTESEIHLHLEKRADRYIDMRVLAATKRDLGNRNEWLCFLAMEFGMVEDSRGILRMHRGKMEPVERDLSFEEVAAHYHMSAATVKEYDRRARRIFKQHRDQAAYLVSLYGPDWEGDL